MEHNFKICVECNQFLNEIDQFLTKTRIINEMFIEIEQVEQLQQQQQQHQTIHPENPELLVQDENAQPNKFDYNEHILSIRVKFGLQPSLTPGETLSNLFSEPDNITEALEIKLESDIEDFDVQDALSEDQEEISESSEEDEEEDSEIEQLSDSQLRKHEELQLLNETSESGREDKKKRKRKYRKSDEEKLFE